MVWKTLTFAKLKSYGKQVQPGSTRGLYVLWQAGVLLRRVIDVGLK